MEQTWFITGSSRGLGRALVRAALDAGDLVAATARQPAPLEDLVVEYGERIHTISLDVTDARGARSAIGEARRHFGRLDVVVNNAGYANVSPIETTDDEDFRAQFETNFWGVYHVSKAAIPVLREQGGGLVMQISSVGGRVGGSPGIASYQAAKFAIDGFSRVLRSETAPFGVQVLVVEPSGFRTDWAGSSMTVHDIPEAYAPIQRALPDGVSTRPVEVEVSAVADRSFLGYNRCMAKTIAQRELRNDNARVIEAVAAGESFVVTRNGVPVAELRPIQRVRRTFVPKAELLVLASTGPRIDRERFRADLDRVVDQSL